MSLRGAPRRYRERLSEAGLRGSMSRTGNPYDNAQVESFIKTLKHEELYLHDYANVQDAIDRLPHSSKTSTTEHSSLGYLPPEEYEALDAQTAA
jgi:putative transposase